MKKALITTFGSLIVLVMPLVASAQTVRNLADLGTLVINTINNILVPVVFAIAFIVFIWGAFTAFILGAQDDTAKTNGKNLMLWSLIGFFVMVSIWGLVNILTGTITFGERGGIQGGLPGAGVRIGN